MIDTHAHLDFENYNKDRVDVIRRCREKLDFVVNIGVNPKSNQAVVALAREYDFLYSTLGIHPEEAEVYYPKLKEISFGIESLIKDKDNKVIALGEVGLDYHLNPPISSERKHLQKGLFRYLIEIAINFNLPLIIHSRDAFEDTLSILSECNQTKSLIGVWHSFTYGLSEAKKILDLGLSIGINGIVTFPSAKNLQAAVKEIPLSRLVLETDSPFLAPQPVRGKRCEPWMVEWVGEEVARLKDLSKEEVFRVTDENARKLFNLNDQFSKIGN